MEETDMTDQSQSAREMGGLADWLAHMQKLNSTLAHVPQMAEHIAKLKKWEASLRLAAQAAPGEPVAWREAFTKIVTAALNDACRKHVIKVHEYDQDILARAIAGALATPAALPQDGRDPATIEALRIAMTCLQSIADMKEDEPREPDDADWRWRALECKRCATVTLAALSSKGK